jgi:DNA polymerase III subunit epsilon
MKFIAILDTETISLEPPPIGRAIEVAVMLYDIKHAQPVSSYASLIGFDGNKEWGMSSNPAEHVNGIPSTMVADAPAADLVWRAVKWLIAPAELILCHRAEFDRQFVPDLGGKPFCCSKSDLRFPGQRGGDHLVQLALSLGLGVASAHRAMADVDILARILTRVAEKGHDLEALLTRAMRPKVLYYAQVSYDDRQLAKDHGFMWNQEKHGKNWYRYMPPEDVKELPFPVRTVPS